jgi:iron(III) transport system substrate-binding protein
MNRNFKLTAASLLAAAIALSACAAPVAAPPTAAPQPAQPAAQTADSTAGELTIYTSRAEALFKPVVEAFNTKYPDIKLTVLNGSNGELAAKILEERANPKADVLINSDTLTMESLAAEGVFEPNDSKSVGAVPEAYRAADGNWVALTLRQRVIMYNTDLVKPEELPKSLLDLADPKWKEQIGSADSRNGAMMANLVALRELVGAEKTTEFVKGLVANETAWFSGHTEVRKAVGAGEIKLGFVNHYYYFLSKAEGAPVGIIYPDQDTFGLVVNSTNAGIIKGSKNVALAKTFVDFMLSADGQKVFAEKNFEYPVVPEVALAEGVPPLADFKLANVTLKTMWDELEPTKQLAQAAGLP